MTSSEGRCTFSVQGVLNVRLHADLPGGPAEIALSAFGEDHGHLAGSSLRARRSSVLSERFELEWRGGVWRYVIPALATPRLTLPDGRVLSMRAKGILKPTLTAQDGSVEIVRRALSVSGTAAWRGADRLPAMLLILYAYARIWYAEVPVATA